MSWTDCETPKMGNPHQEPAVSLVQMGRSWGLRINGAAARLAGLSVGDMVKLQRQDHSFRVVAVTAGKPAQGTLIDVRQGALVFSTAGAILKGEGYRRGRAEVKAIYKGVVVFDASPIKPLPVLVPREKGKIGRPRKWRDAGE